MKKGNLKKYLLLLTALVTIVAISYGSNPPDSTNHTLINNSIKCFEEVKVLGSRINKTDSINLELEKKVARLTFLSDTCAKTNTVLTNNNNALKSKNTTLKTYLKLLGGISLIELLVIVLK